ncbi:Transcription factor bye1 [Ceratocystis pirilliformis]|uniref:Transcription factor BYE1 n=1 Tax=Ceratocystis pirilliformis TaxID=259994 RepID=A0ABR3YQV3_9PEZI
MSAEPRRSVRATKGQHKALDQLDQTPEPKKRQAKRNSKKKESEEPEEVIRCVCGATEQSTDESEPWIACDKCGVWQHNVCMGMSVFTEDLPKNYYCEQCEPQDHTELLEGMEAGDLPWETRRRIHEDEESEKRKRKTKRGRGKKVVDNKDEVNSRSKSPEMQHEPPKPEPATKAAATGKRKTRAESPLVEKNGPAHKLRKISQIDAASIKSKYTPPPDLAASASELPDTRQGTVKVLMKALSHILNSVMKRGVIELTPGATVDSTSERLGLEIERAVFDTHASQKEYAQQCRTLAFNLKSNEELILRIFRGHLFPNMLALMTTEELASRELQRENAQMKARADKQAILVDEPTRRVRKTHRGEELVEEDTYLDTEEAPPPTGGVAIKKEQTSQSPIRPSFDMNKVYAKMKSPSAAQQRRFSNNQPLPSGPGIDHDVDRLLAEKSPSPQLDDYPSDPNTIWKGNLAMSTLANIQVRATYAGGCNLQQTKGLPWESLFPKRLEVAGRIDQQKAVEYLCGLRYNDYTDIVVTAVTPTAERFQEQFQAAIHYFVSKGRYGVISDKGVSNIRDTYLVPVASGSKNLPEFMLNFSDNLLPQERAEPILLVVFVYRDESRLQRTTQPQQQQNALSNGLPASSPLESPTPGARFLASTSNGGPGAPEAGAQQTLPVIQGQSPSRTTTPQTYTQSHAHVHHSHASLSESDRKLKQIEGERLAHEIVGSYLDAPTMKFLLPQAWQMSRREWEVVREVFTADARTRNDLGHLSRMLEMRRSPNQQQRAQAQPQAQTQSNA